MTQDIDWVQASGVYVTVHTAGEKFLYRSALAAVASRLESFRFIRIDRSGIVNLKSIRTSRTPVAPLFSGIYSGMEPVS